MVFAVPNDIGFIDLPWLRISGWIGTQVWALVWAWGMWIQAKSFGFEKGTPDRRHNPMAFIRWSRDRISYNVVSLQLLLPYHICAAFRTNPNFMLLLCGHLPCFAYGVGLLLGLGVVRIDCCERAFQNEMSCYSGVRVWRIVRVTRWSVSSYRARTLGLG